MSGSIPLLSNYQVYEHAYCVFLFLLLTITSAAVEIWVIYKIIETGDISFSRGAVSIINAGALAYFIRAFGKLVNRTFIDKDLINEDDLKKLEEIIYYKLNLPAEENPFYVTLFLTAVSYQIQYL